MPASMQWRDRKDGLEPLSFGSDVTIGSGRRAVRGYLAHSQRVGPGIVVVSPSFDDGTRELVDRCRDEGFTALAIELPEEEPARAVVEATQSLVANWHPRVGLLALPGTAAIALEVDATERLDAVVAWGAAAAELGSFRAPVWGEPVADDEGLADALDHLTYHLS